MPDEGKGGGGEVEGGGGGGEVEGGGGGGGEEAEQRKRLQPQP